MYDGSPPPYAIAFDVECAARFYADVIIYRYVVPYVFPYKALKTYRGVAVYIVLSCAYLTFRIDSKDSVSPIKKYAATRPRSLDIGFQRKYEQITAR